jgi:membrane protein
LEFPKYTISIANVFFWIFITLILFVILLLTYRFVPHIKLKFLQILPGTLFSLGGSFLLTYGFSTYVSKSVRYSALYGSISSVLMLLIWMYFIGILIIFGAELNSSIMELRRKRYSGTQGGELPNT